VPGLGAYEEILPEVVTLEIGGLQIPVLSLEQLIQAKSVLDQPKDREHLDQLLAIRTLLHPE
jgi:predicted nucleotidyltransferase